MCLHQSHVEGVVMVLSPCCMRLRCAAESDLAACVIVV